MNWETDAAVCGVLSEQQLATEVRLAAFAIHGIAGLARAGYPQAQFVILEVSDQDHDGIVYSHVEDINGSELLSEALIEGSFEDAMWDFTCHLRQFLVEESAFVKQEGVRHDPRWNVHISEVLGEE